MLSGSNDMAAQTAGPRVVRQMSPTGSIQRIRSRLDHRGAASLRGRFGVQKTLIMSGIVDKRPRLVANPVKQNMPVVADIELPFKD